MCLFFQMADDSDVSILTPVSTNFLQEKKLIKLRRSLNVRRLPDF